MLLSGFRDLKKLSAILIKLHFLLKPTELKTEQNYSGHLSIVGYRLLVFFAFLSKRNILLNILRYINWGCLLCLPVPSVPCGRVAPSLECRSQPSLSERDGCARSNTSLEQQADDEDDGVAGFGCTTTMSPSPENLLHHSSASEYHTFTED